MNTYILIYGYRQDYKNIYKSYHIQKFYTIEHAKQWFNNTYSTKKLFDVIELTVVKSQINILPLNSISWQ